MKTVKTEKTKIFPLSDRVLIKDLAKSNKETITKSGIILSGGDEDKSTKKGQVIAVGPGKIDDGVKINMTLKVGDTVLYSWGDKVNIDGEEYTLARESDILAIIK